MALNGRVAIVTGGAMRLGRAYCLALAASGARVVVADIRDPKLVVDEISAAGGSAIGVKIDICDQKSLATMVDVTLNAYGAIEVLVNNAGYFRDSKRGTFEDIPIEQLDRSLAVNVKGTWLATKAVVPTMRAANRGKIINVSSGSVWKGQSGTGPHYLTAKAALIGFTRALARELGPYNISVNTLVPDATPDNDTNELWSETDRTVTARCFQRLQKPSDLVGTLMYLCGSGSDFVTGQSFHVNGGSYFA